MNERQPLRHRWRPANDVTSHERAAHRKIDRCAHDCGGIRLLSRVVREERPPCHHVATCTGLKQTCLFLSFYI